MNGKTKKAWHLVILLAVDLAFLVLIASLSSADAMHLGCNGRRVAEIQQHLYDKGFYSSKISGEFNTETRKAIKKFQKEKNLKHSGKADHATLSAMGITSRNGIFFEAETELLARYIQAQGCRNYPQMLKKAKTILASSQGVSTMSNIIFTDNPDCVNIQPSDDAYNAAAKAIKDAKRGLSQ